MCIRVGEDMGLTIIECGAPILSALMVAEICGPTFEIPVSEGIALDVDWLLKYTIKVGFYAQNLVIIYHAQVQLIECFFT